MKIQSLLAAAVLVATPALAQDETQNFNAFAVVAANGAIIRAGDNQARLVGTLSGPFFVETDEGPVHTGRVTCAVSAKVDLDARRQAGSGGCTFTALDGATAWGDWECEGYELLGCRGPFKLAGGTGRLDGAKGEGTLTWRPSAHELRKQMSGAALDNATGILLWRDIKLAPK